MNSQIIKFCKIKINMIIKKICKIKKWDKNLYIGY